MIRIYYGEDRVRAKKSAEEILGDEHEVIEGSEIQLGDLTSIFLGGTLFAEKRKILIKDLAEEKAIFEKLPEFLETPHEIVILESKLDKRTSTYKKIKDKVEIKEFKMPENVDPKMVFDIFKVAKRDGRKAVEMLGKIEETQEPYMFLGLLVSQAIKDFDYTRGDKEKKVLKELSDLDIMMKTTSTQPMLLLKSFLLRVSSL